MPEYPSSGGGGAAGVAVTVTGHTANSVPVASGSTSLADLAMAASTILARLAAGNIVAATPAQLKTLLAIAEGDVAGLTADLATLAAAVAAKADAAATATALALLAPLASPTFTGVATAPSVSSTGKTGATAQATILAGGTASGAPTTGAHVVGELVVDVTGAAWYCTVAGTPGTWVQIGARSNILGSTSYNPASQATTGTTSATFANIDGTNLAVSFVAPASGKVLVTLTAAVETNQSTVYAWNLREGGSDLAGTSAGMAYMTSNSNLVQRQSHVVLVSGLTPGSAHTYTWGHARTSGVGAVDTIYGGASWGAAVMVVQAA